MASSRLAHPLGSLRPSQPQGLCPSLTRRADPHPWNHCSPLAALPSGKSPAGASPPVSLLDRAPDTAALAAAAAAPSAPAAPSPPSAAAAAPPLPDLTAGLLSLSMVPIVWGTYNPCIRYLYAEADPLDPASLTAVRTVLSASALLLPALVGYLYKEGREAWRRKRQLEAQRDSATRGSTGDATGSRDGEPHVEAHHASLSVTLAGAADGAADGVAAVAAAEEGAAAVVSAGPAPGARRPLFSEPLSTSRLGPVITCTFNSVVLAGLELGVLNFMGTALQVEGLHSTSATRAGFLAEVTAVLVPFVSYLAGYEIPRQMWLAVAVGLVGSTMVAYDTSQPHDTQAPAAAAVSSVAGTAGTVAAGAASNTVAATSNAVAATSNAVGVVAPGAALEVAASAPLLAPGALSASSDVAAGEAVAITAANVIDALSDVAGSAADAMTLAADSAASAALAASAAAGAALEAAADAAADAAAASTTAAVVAAEAVAATGTQLEITGGEGYLLLACVFYSVCTVRMGIYAPRMDTVSLAAMKKVGLSSMSMLWMASTNLQNGAALDSVFAFPDLSARAPISIAVLLYSGLGPGALATFLQVSGLSTVPATTAQVIYSMTPLCTAFFAYLILGGEATGPVAWAGGSLIIVAALMAANAQRQQHQQQAQQQLQES